jgi:membrane-associated phospholipid phosphatase
MDALPDQSSPSLSPASGRLRLYSGPDIHPQTLLLRFLLLGSIVASMAVPLCTLIDVPVARWFLNGHLSGDVRQAIGLTESYTHGIGILFLLISILTMAPQKRWCVPRLATMAFGASAVATIVKMFVLRPRPTQLNLSVASNDAAWLWSFDWTLDQIAAFDAGTRSFPTGGIATAVALSVGLSMLFPRGRFLFLLFTLFSALERLQTGSHFPSDVLGGIACGLFWCFICLHSKLLGILFEQMEPQRRGYRVVNREIRQQAA